MIAERDMKWNEKIFSYVTTNDIVYHFAADRLRNWCVMTRFPVTSLLLHPGYIEPIIEGHGTEQHRLDAITGPIREPVLIIDHENGYHTTIDGNHRSVKAYQRGEKSIIAYIVPKRVWSAYLVDMGTNDSPTVWRDRMKRGFFSGIEGSS